MEELTRAQLGALLNLTCWKTNTPILPGDRVVLHNWGFASEPLTTGHFYWDDQFRQFWFSCDEDAKQVDIDQYDLFRTIPAKVEQPDQL